MDDTAEHTPDDRTEYTYNEYWVLVHDGPVPMSTLFYDLDDGRRARDKARQNGFHVRLIKGGIGNAETRPLSGDNPKRKPSFADRLRTKFRRRYTNG